jgi:16S rRNA (adenine1518-N6/adenine1519-N6)-dimethyltransferase
MHPTRARTEKNSLLRQARSRSEKNSGKRPSRGLGEKSSISGRARRPAAEQSADSHQARKRFGQHFLRDQKIIQQIVAAIAPEPGQRLIEIGPGLGALTIPVLDLVGSLAAIEVDRDVVPILQEACKDIGDLLIYQKDVLHFDLSVAVQDKKLLRVFGNLPYNISTPLIFHLIKYTNRISDMHFMLQKEVAERLCAPPGGKTYSRLSVMVQYHYQIKQLLDVPPQAFKPAPRVDSRVVRMIPYKKIPYLANDYARFETIVKQAFGQRRKTLRNSLSGLKEGIPEESWIKAKIDPSKRAENLSVEDFVRLSNCS